MSDTPITPATPADAPAPIDPKIHAALAADLEVVRGTFAAVKGERDGLAAQLAEATAALSAATSERDALAGKATEASKALETLTNRTRERDVLDGLRAAFPGADATTIRGSFLALVEDGKVARFPEDPAKAVPVIVDLLKQAAPTLSRAPVNGGGPPPPAPPKSGARAGASFWNIGQRQ